MLDSIKHFLIGTPLRTQEFAEQRLNKIRALAAFSPDALSSIAYANQEIYLGLVVAGSAGLALSWPIGLAITGLMLVVALSYLQTIHAYPSGGGSYAVARRNLGLLPGLVVAAALMIGYLLTAAVSLTAGVAAISSAFPELWTYRVPLSLLFLLLIAMLNLRGARETGTGMAVPVYFFLATYLPMLAYGLLQVLRDGAIAPAAAAPPASQPLTSILVLRAFAAGCTALTGVEAISNGVPAFRRPETRNAGQTLGVMAALMAVLFVGSIGLTHTLAAVAGPDETILSALARRILGGGLGYYVIQIATLAILVVAANTSFAGFPRLAAILAADGFLPRQLSALGDRLSFDNGILVLTGATGGLILAFSGDSHALIPLFAVGVFLAFTLSQAGMVVHWWRVRGAGWVLKASMNGIGALVTGTTVLIIAITRFIEGAWIAILAIPLLIGLFLPIRAHYQQVGRELSLGGLPPSLRPAGPARVVVPISGVHRGMIGAINFARSISSKITGLYIELEPGMGERVLKEWKAWWPDIPLALRPSPYRSILRPLLEFLEETDREANDGQLAVVVLPEFIPRRGWQAFLHNQTAWLLKAALLYRRSHSGAERVIIDVPYHLKH